jgi:hypothetical protein
LVHSDGRHLAEISLRSAWESEPTTHLKLTVPAAFMTSHDVPVACANEFGWSVTRLPLPLGCASGPLNEQSTTEDRVRSWLSNDVRAVTK